MQDNYKHIDKIFKDQMASARDYDGIHDAWSKMESMLDKNYRKKKPLGSWWSLSILITAITAGSIWGVKSIFTDDTPIDTPTVNAKAIKDISLNSAIPTSLSDENKTSSKKEIVTYQSNNNHKSTRNNTTVANQDNAIPRNQKPARIVKTQSELSLPATELSTIDKIIISNEGKIATNVDEMRLVDKNKPKVKMDNATITKTKKDLISKSQNGELLASADNVIVKKQTQQIQHIAIREKKIMDDDKLVGIKEDTISITKSQKVQYLPLAKEEIYALQGMHTLMVQQADKERYRKILVADVVNVPSMEVKAKYSKESTMVDRSRASVQEESIMSKLDINRFILANKKWTGSLLLGGNMNLPYAPIGADAGFRLNYRLSDLWSIGSGINYLLRRSNNSITDQEIKYTLISSEPTPAGYFHKISKTSSTNQYSVPNIHQIDIPLSVTLHARRWEFWAGPIMSIATTQQHQSTTDVHTEQLQIINNNESYAPQDVDYSAIGTQDFSTKLGLGYHLGTAYKVHDKWSIYSRLNHNLWDNSNTVLGNQISKSFLKLPNISVGLQFHFNSGKKVKLLLDEDKR